MQYYFFHLMSWPYLPPDFDATCDSAWVWLPNSLYDPQKGADLYQSYIDTLALADELGFDGVCVNEHHQNAYGLMPSPNLIASASYSGRPARSPSSATPCRCTTRRCAWPRSSPCST